MGVARLAVRSFSSFHLDAKMGSVACFSQNITKGVVLCHIISTLTNDGMMSKRVKGIARAKCTLGPLGCVQAPLYGNLMDWWIKV